MGDDDNKKAEVPSFVYSIIFIILFAIATKNYTKEEADSDGIGDYWEYGFIKLVISIVIASSACVSCCGAALTLKTGKGPYAFMTFFGITLFATIITDFYYMFTIVDHHPELADFHLKDTTNGSGQMLQYLCMFCFVFDCIAVAILGCLFLWAPCLCKMCKE